MLKSPYPCIEKENWHRKTNTSKFKNSLILNFQGFTKAFVSTDENCEKVFEPVNNFVSGSLCAII